MNDAWAPFLLCGHWGVLPTYRYLLGFRILRPASSFVGVGQPCLKPDPVSRVPALTCVRARTGV